MVIEYKSEVEMENGGSHIAGRELKFLSLKSNYSPKLWERFLIFMGPESRLWIG